MNSNSNSQKTKRGLLISFEGLDGSGKTVTSLTVQEMLEQHGHTVKYISFPQYDSSFFGPILKQVLNHPDVVTIDPKLLTFLFAGDRFESRDKIINWLDQGFTVVANRYVTSNIAYGMAKSQDHNEFKMFNEKLEYDLCGMPKPDFVIYLDTPLETIKGRLKNKDQDAYEKDVSFLEKVRECYMDLVKTCENWKYVSTFSESESRILDPNEISAFIVNQYLSK